MRASDIMTTKVITVGPDAPVSDVARVLVDNRISAVPVVESDGHLIGIVSEGDLIRRLGDESEARKSWWLEILASPETRAEAYVKSHGRTARDVMSTDVVAVGEQASLGEIAHLLEEKHVKRVPVLRDDRVVGIVSRADLLRAMALSKALPEPHGDDRALRNDLLKELERAGLGYHPYVNILVQDGAVHLWGFASSSQEAKALELAASNVPGVREVRSHLAIRAVASPV
jgi:CBS domain-containing protein